MSQIVATPMKSYVKASGITAINPVIHKNTNGYPFITVMRGKEAENVYFGKRTAEAIKDKDRLTKEDFSAMKVIQAENAEGEERTKLSMSDFMDTELLFD